MTSSELKTNKEYNLDIKILIAIHHKQWLNPVSRKLTFFRPGPEPDLTPKMQKKHTEINENDTKIIKIM